MVLRSVEAPIGRPDLTTSCRMIPPGYGWCGDQRGDLVAPSATQSATPSREAITLAVDAVWPRLHDGRFPDEGDTLALAAEGSGMIRAAGGRTRAGGWPATTGRVESLRSRTRGSGAETAGRVGGGADLWTGLVSHTGT